MSTSPAEILDSLSAVSVHLVDHPILFVSLSYRLSPPATDITVFSVHF